jgi:hypothetical protein
MSNDRKTPTVDLRGLARSTSAHDTVPELPAVTGAPSSFDVSLASVPLVVVAPEELLALPLDARFGFLLSLIDGASTVEDVLDVIGLERGEAIEMIADLVQRGVIVLRRA